MDIIASGYFNFFGHQYLGSDSTITDFVKDPRYFAVKNDKIITMSRYLGSTVWEMAHNNTDFGAKAVEAKEKNNRNAALKYLFFRRLQTEAKEYVLGTLNGIFVTLDRWITIKK